MGQNAIISSLDARRRIADIQKDSPSPSRGLMPKKKNVRWDVFPASRPKAGGEGGVQQGRKQTSDVGCQRLNNRHQKKKDSPSPSRGGSGRGECSKTESRRQITGIDERKTPLAGLDAEKEKRPVGRFSGIKAEGWWGGGSATIQKSDVRVGGQEYPEAKIMNPAPRRDRIASLRNRGIIASFSATPAENMNSLPPWRRQ